MDEKEPVGRRRFLAESLTIGGIVAASAAWAILHERGPVPPREGDRQPLMGIVARPASPAPRPPQLAVAG